MLFKELSEDLVHAGLERLKNGPVPGLDGICACVHQTFSDVFVPRMHDTMRALLVGAPLSDDWSVALISSIPKVAGTPMVDQLHPISICNVLLKWITTTMLLQIEDLLQQVVPQEQKGYLRGQQLTDHLWHAAGAWFDMTRGFMRTIDFRKAYDSVTFNYLDAVLRVMQLPSSYVSLILMVVSTPGLFVVNGAVVHNVVHHPSSAIRQGDPLSPALFVLVVSQVILALKRSLPDVIVIMYVDDLLLYLPGTREACLAVLRDVCFSCVGIWAVFRIAHERGQKQNHAQITGPGCLCRAGV